MTASAARRPARTTRFVVGRVDEIPPGERRIVEANGREIGVFNVGTKGRDPARVS